MNRTSLVAWRAWVVAPNYNIAHRLISLPTINRWNTTFRSWTWTWGLNNDGKDKTWKKTHHCSSFKCFASTHSIIRKIVDGKYIQFTKKIMYNYGVIVIIKSSTYHENHSPIHIHCNSNNNARSFLFWSCLHIYIIHRKEDATSLVSNGNCDNILYNEWIGL